ncbi:MAG: hypothetical protein IKE38_03470, partial [Erysipelotrichaceae bacterium]|nr:hypothetical protein [Erysipelotrichaceae bacterium]
TSLIKHGKDRAVIEGVFSIEDESLKRVLEEQDIDSDGDELIVKRVINSDGHNSIRINESSVTLNFLSELLSKYVDIHSQKDSQKLYSRQYQLELLDRFADDNDLLEKYAKAYREYLGLKKEYDEILENEYNDREIEFFRYDLDELERADLKEGEEEELEQKEKLYKSSEKYLTVLNNALDIYKKDSGLKEQFYDLINTLSIDDERISRIRESLNNAYYSLDEEMDKLDEILYDFSSGSIDIDRIEERLYTYTKLKRKHHCDTASLLKLKDDLRNRIEAYEDRDRVLGEKMKKVEDARGKALSISKEIHEKRLTAAEEMEKEVQKETADLLLNNCVFKVKIENCELNTKGSDEVEFHVSMNKGEELKPLKNVASGGEISRLMLALKSVFSRISDTDLLILDEIDTGVSGNVALAVGEKIARISRNCQVLCITHLSPVAACADTHYLIYKEDDENGTRTKVKRLVKDEILNELASISNTSTNAKAIEAAAELYENAQKLAGKR